MRVQRFAEFHHHQQQQLVATQTVRRLLYHRCCGVCLVCECTVAADGAHAPLYHLLSAASCSNVCFNTRFVMSAARTTRGCMFRQATIQAKLGFGTFLRKADKEMWSLARFCRCCTSLIHAAELILSVNMMTSRKVKFVSTAC